MKRLLALCVVVALAGAVPVEASTRLPGSRETCRTDSSYGTLRASSGRTFYLAMPKTGGYIPQTRKATTRAYSPSGDLLWTVDYRVEPSRYLTRYTLNRDAQTHRSGTYFVTTFWWDRAVLDSRCTAWSRVP